MFTVDYKIAGFPKIYTYGGLTDLSRKDAARVAATLLDDPSVTDVFVTSKKES